MNSKQRRARIRAGMPNVLRRITTMKLIGDMDARDADHYIAALQSPHLKLRDFDVIVRTVAVAERGAGFMPRMTGRTKPYTFVIG